LEEYPALLGQQGMGLQVGAASILRINVFAPNKHPAGLNLPSHPVVRKEGDRSLQSGMQASSPHTANGHCPSFA